MVPVVEALAARHVRVSVDTVKPAVAEAALAAGATLVNDVSASLSPVAARRRVGWVAMHMQGDAAAPCSDDPRYDDVVAEVRDFLLERAPAARRVGVAEVWVDPGIGFGKTVAHNLALLAHLPELVRAAESPGARGGRRHQPQALPRVLAAPGAAARAPVADRPEGSLATAAGALVSGAADGARARRGGHGARWPGCMVRSRVAMKGKWAAGIPPRNFTWVIRDHLAVSERPGGFAPNHRRVRRQEEIIWLRVQGFGRVVSLLPSPHNLAAYDEEGLAWANYPLGASATRGPCWPTATGPRRLAGRGPAHPRPPGRAGRPGDGCRGRVPGVVRTDARPAAGRRPGRARWSGTPMGRPGASSWWPYLPRAAMPAPGPGPGDAATASRSSTCGWPASTGSCPRSASGRSRSTRPLRLGRHGRGPASDELADTVDYGALAQAAADVVAGRSYRLLEALAERLADRCSPSTPGSTPSGHGAQGTSSAGPRRGLDGSARAPPPR